MKAAHQPGSKLTSTSAVARDSAQHGLQSPGVNMLRPKKPQPSPEKGLFFI